MRIADSAHGMGKRLLAMRTGCRCCSPGEKRTGTLGRRALFLRRFRRRQKLDEIEDDLKTVASRQYHFPLVFSSPRFLGRGTAVEIESTELISLRNKLANRWSEYLTNQDRQKFMPHITVQNKVEPEEARILFEGMKESWQTKRGTAIALQLWHYRNGPWQIANEFAFYKTADLTTS